MGVIYIDGVATGPTAKKATVRFLVDSGATYSLIPHRDWQQIELRAKRPVSFAAGRWHDDPA